MYELKQLARLMLVGKHNCSQLVDCTRFANILPVWVKLSGYLTKFNVCVPPFWTFSRRMKHIGSLKVSSIHAYLVSFRRTYLFRHPRHCVRSEEVDCSCFLLLAIYSRIYTRCTSSRELCTRAMEAQNTLRIHYAFIRGVNLIAIVGWVTYMVGVEI
jgi:hypothetical protein